MWYICAVEYYSAIKKNEIMLFAATWVGLEIDCHTEQSKTEKEKYRMTDFLCMQNLKRNDTNEQINLFTKQKQIHRLREKTYCCQGVRSGEKELGSLGLKCKHCYIKNG